MLTVLSFLNIISNDLAQPWELGFQDGASPGFTGIVDLHNTIFFYLVIISIGVFWILGSIIYFYKNTSSLIIHKYLNHGTLKCLHAYTPKIVINKLKFNDTLKFNDCRLISFGLEGLLNQSPFKYQKINKLRGSFPSVRQNVKYLSSTFTFSKEHLPEILENNIQTASTVKSEKNSDDIYTIKSIILKENKNRSGIYRFSNKINGGRSHIFILEVWLRPPLI